jgi:hypothetical protein
MKTQLSILIFIVCALSLTSRAQALEIWMPPEQLVKSAQIIAMGIVEDVHLTTEGTFTRFRIMEQFKGDSLGKAITIWQQRKLVNNGKLIFESSDEPSFEIGAQVITSLRKRDDGNYYADAQCMYSVEDDVCWSSNGRKVASSIVSMYDVYTAIHWIQQDDPATDSTIFISGKILRPESDGFTSLSKDLIPLEVIDQYAGNPIGKLFLLQIPDSLRWDDGRPIRDLLRPQIDSVIYACVTPTGKGIFRLKPPCREISIRKALCFRNNFSEGRLPLPSLPYPISLDYFRKFIQFCRDRQAHGNELIRKSDAIILGRVNHMECRWESETGSINTIYTMEIYNVFKGDIKGSSMGVCVPGGVTRDTVVYHENTPIFMPGDIRVFFLDRKVDANKRPWFEINGGVSGVLNWYFGSIIGYSGQRGGYGMSVIEFQLYVNSVLKN